jgi:hypothetical protein
MLAGRGPPVMGPTRRQPEPVRVHGMGGTEPGDGAGDGVEAALVQDARRAPAATRLLGTTFTMLLWDPPDSSSILPACVCES